jgi:hypothetical protein
MKKIDIVAKFDLDMTNSDFIYNKTKKVLCLLNEIIECVQNVYRLIRIEIDLVSKLVLARTVWILLSKKKKMLLLTAYNYFLS